MPVETLTLPTISEHEPTPTFGDYSVADSQNGNGHKYTYSSDGIQSERLAWHHESMKLCLGGLYPCPDLVRKILAPTPGEKKRIIDVGCGSRMWALEMAKEFPHVEILGVDRPHVQAIWKDDAPENCRFEAKADYSFLRDHEKQYDIVHMRFVAGGCAHFLNLLDAIETSLKPGGLFILIDSTGKIIAQDGSTSLRMKTTSHPEGSRLRRLLWEVHHINCHLGFDENMMLATLEDGLWESTDLEECKAAELLVPIGPWRTSKDPAEQKRLKDAGWLMSRSLQALQPGHHSVLRSYQFDENHLKKWSQEIDSELNEDNHKLSLDVRVLWGRRPLETAARKQWPIANLTSNALREFSARNRTVQGPPRFVPKAPYWHVYDSQSKLRRALDKRRIQGGGIAERVEPFVHKMVNQSPRSPHPLGSRRSSRVFER